MNASLLSRLLLLIVCLSPATFAADDSGAVYFTNGVHNTEGCNAQNGNCIAKRLPGEPSDPFFPAQWISNWTMYRVMTNYGKTRRPTAVRRPP